MAGGVVDPEFHTVGDGGVGGVLEGEAQDDGDDGGSGEKLVDVPFEGKGAENKDGKEANENVDDLMDEAGKLDLSAPRQDRDDGEAIEEAKEREKQQCRRDADQP